MRAWAGWYKMLLVLWVIIGLPGLVVAYGMSGGEIGLPSGSLLDIIPWSAALLFIFSPALLWPWRKRQE